MNNPNTINPKYIRQLNRSGYLEKIKPSIPVEEEILDIHLNVFALNRIMGYVFIPIFTVLLSSLTVSLENEFDMPYVNFTWFSVVLIVSIIIYIYFIFFSKRGYEIKILAFTNKAIYLFDSVHKSVERQDYEKHAKYISFYRSTYVKKFYIGLGLNFEIKLNKDSLKFIYFLLYNYCTPKAQIKNRLLNDKGTHDENDIIKIIQQSEFKISNEKNNDIYNKRKGLLNRGVTYEIITILVIIGIILFFQFYQSDYGWWIVLIDLFVIIIGGLIIYGIPQTSLELHKSLKKMTYIPNSVFKISDNGINAISQEREVWIPFEDELIIGTYDSIEKFFMSKCIYDAIDLCKIDDKKNSRQIGPVEDHEHFDLIVLNHYLNWLHKNDLILKKEFVKTHYLNSDSFKELIIEKIRLKEPQSLIPESYNIPTFSINSEKLSFKYSREIYNRYMTNDEEIYQIFKQEGVPHSILKSGISEIMFLIILCLGVLFLLFVPYSYPDIIVLIIIILVLGICVGLNFNNTMREYRRIMFLEAIFTEEKIIFRRKDWIYPLAYDDIKIVRRLDENIRKRYYKKIEFHSKKKGNVMTLYDIDYDNPILKILDSKCNVE